jgi:hypothetical protein
MVIERSEYPERIIRTGYKSELDCPKVKQEADRVSCALEILRREQPQGVVGQSRCKLVGSMSPAAIDDPHDRCANFTEGNHHLMEMRCHTGPPQ